MARAVAVSAKKFWAVARCTSAAGPKVCARTLAGLFLFYFWSSRQDEFCAFARLADPPQLRSVAPSSRGVYVVGRVYFNSSMRQINLTDNKPSMQSLGIDYGYAICLCNEGNHRG